MKTCFQLQEAIKIIKLAVFFYFTGLLLIRKTSGFLGISAKLPGDLTLNFWNGLRKMALRNLRSGALSNERAGLCILIKYATVDQC
jgi:hypothetical protein